MDHNCLAYSNLASGVDWEFVSQENIKQTMRPRICFECNNGEVLADLAVLGEGITMLPAFIVDRLVNEGKLDVILKGWQAPTIWLTAYYPPYEILPEKVKAFTAFVEDTIDKSLLQVGETKSK